VEDMVGSGGWWCDVFILGHICPSRQDIFVFAQTKKSAPRGGALHTRKFGGQLLTLQDVENADVRHCKSSQHLDTVLLRAIHKGLPN
jgi:hypothetical protein